MSWLKAKDWATGVEYSSLFHSGLRTISLRPRDHCGRTPSSSSSWEKSSSGGASSIGSRSSRLVSCHPSPSMSRGPSPASRSRAPKATRPRPSSMFVRPTEEMEGAWLYGKSFIEIDDYPKFDDESGYGLPPIEMDAVRSLAGSHPLFVNLGEMKEVGDDSFLLLSNSADRFLHHPIPRRPHPVSVGGDCAWMLEDSSPELKAYDEDEEDDVRDWRQFHVEWVRNIR